MSVLVPLAGIGFGLGLCLVLRGLFAPLPPLQATAGFGPRVPNLLVRPDRTPRPLAPVAAVGRTAAMLGLRVSARERHDLALFALDEAVYLGMRILGTCLGAAIAAAAAPFVPSGASLGLSGTLLVGVAGTVVVLGPAVGGPRLLAAAARRRRESFLDAFDAFLGLLGALLAGGVSTEGALVEASAPGDGWAHQRIRSALRGRMRGFESWEVLALLGWDTRVRAVERLAVRIDLALHEGASVRDAVVEQSAELASVRRNAAREAAERTTTYMNYPLAGMVIAYLGFFLVAGLDLMRRTF